MAESLDTLVADADRAAAADEVQFRRLSGRAGRRGPPRQRGERWSP